MAVTIEHPALACDFLEFLLARERSYEECMSAWRTSCPRLAIYEDCLDAGLAAIRYRGSVSHVTATEVGRRYLREQRPSTSWPMSSDGDGTEHKSRGGQE